MPVMVIATKLALPPVQPRAVARPVLLERLNAGLSQGRRLTLICAPAGYGKTSLAAQWAAQAGCPTAWLTLEERENDPARFFTYLIHSLRRLDPDLGSAALSVLSLPQLPALEDLAIDLINQLESTCSRLGKAALLVLDDFHTLHEPALLDVMAFFIDHLPAGLHLALTTREDPPLPLARLRARNQLTEVRAADLQFSPRETELFLQDTMGLRLSSQAAQILATKTEGWVAGLQLAGLALQGRAALADEAGFLERFQGSHRYVIDYLVEEVLSVQPEPIQGFLRAAAVPGRVCADLAAALTGAGPDQAAAMLADLERQNLFLISMQPEGEPGWYRFHPLFADALRATLSADQERELRERAAAWLEAHGRLAEAIQHTLALGNAAGAGRLMAQAGEELLRTGELRTLLTWLRAIPEAEIYRTPVLLASLGLCLIMQGSTQEAAALLARAGEAVPDGLQDGAVLAVRAWLHMLGGGARTGEMAEAALQALPVGGALFRILALIVRGTDASWRGDLRRSSQDYAAAAELGQAAHNPFAELTALTNLLFNLEEEGRLQEARQRAQQALARYSDRHGQPLPVASTILIALASNLLAQGELDAAQAAAERARALCSLLFHSGMMGGDAEYVLASIAVYRGDRAAALQLMRDLRGFSQRHQVGFLEYKMALLEIDLLLRAQDVPGAQESLARLENLALDRLPAVARARVMLQARLALAGGSWERALELVAPLEAAARREGAYGRLVGVRILQARCLAAGGQAQAAQQALSEALRLAAGEQARYPFLRAGESLVPLLRAARPAAPEFVDDLLARCIPGAPPSASSPAGLIEPLSEQECRVLQCLVEGRSNQEIAAALVIGVGTAKWHVHNVLQKLGVSSRAQAAARARELGLLPGAASS